MISRKVRLTFDTISPFTIWIFNISKLEVFTVGGIGIDHSTQGNQSMWDVCNFSIITYFFTICNQNLEGFWTKYYYYIPFAIDANEESKKFLIFAGDFNDSCYFVRKFIFEHAFNQIFLIPIGNMSVCGTSATLEHRLMFFKIKKW